MQLQAPSFAQPAPVSGKLAACWLISRRFRFGGIAVRFSSKTPKYPPFPVAAGKGPRGTLLDDKIARFNGFPQDF
jgi:hypothetical protein